MITKELRQTLLTLSPEEKTEIIQLLDGISKSPQVAGGNARIRNTRIPVWSLFQSRRMGTSDLEILEAHPELTPADLTNTWFYVETFPNEIESAIAASGADCMPMKTLNFQSSSGLERKDTIS